MDPYATHQEATVVCALHSGVQWPSSPILELGCGNYSTPLLAAITKTQARKLVVMASSDAWLGQFEYLQGEQIELKHINSESWPRVTLKSGWGMVLVDNEQRVVDRLRIVKRLATKSHVVVLHDADSLLDAEGAFHRLCRWYQFAHLEVRQRPATVVLSNSLDPSAWFVHERT